MVIAHEMEDAVDQQEKNLLLRPPANSRGLSLGSFCRDDYISQDRGMGRRRVPRSHGERNDVGGSVAVKILAVQPGDLFIVYDDDADFMLLTSQGA